jgi:hypothetical protein
MSMPSPVRDALPVALALALCPLVAMLAPDDPADALTRARSLVEAQRALGVTPEPALVRALDAHPSLRALTELLYVWVHLPALVGALVWVRLERPRAFSFARDTFVAAQVVTVTGYLLVPAAPPWMLEAGMTRAPERLAYLLQSPYAAMPSGHTVFALVAGGCVALLTPPARPRRRRGVSRAGAAGRPGDGQPRLARRRRRGRGGGPRSGAGGHPPPAGTPH